MTTTPITGANKGLGREVARRLLADGLDVLVNNAGISGGFEPVPAVTPEDVERVFATNVLGIVRVTQALVPLLERSANPVVVNVSSRQERRRAMATRRASTLLRR